MNKLFLSPLKRINSQVGYFDSCCYELFSFVPQLYTKMPALTPAELNPTYGGRR